MIDRAHVPTPARVAPLRPPSTVASRDTSRSKHALPTPASAPHATALATSYCVVEAAAGRRSSLHHTRLLRTVHCVTSMAPLHQPAAYTLSQPGHPVYGASHSSQGCACNPTAASSGRSAHGVDWGSRTTQASLRKCCLMRWPRHPSPWARHAELAACRAGSHPPGQRTRPSARRRPRPSHLCRQRRRHRRWAARARS